MGTFLSISNILLMLPTAYFALKSLGFLLPVGEERCRKFILFAAFMVLIPMTIFIGDRANLPPTALAFMTAVMVCCRGSRIQRFTIGLMFASSMLAFNGIYDNMSNPHWETRIMLRLLFWLIYYLLIKRFAPPKDYELSPVLWRLILLLTILPMGITCVLVLVPDPYYSFPSFINTTFIICFAISLFSFIGLMWTIIVLAKQQKLEMEKLMSDTNRRYYEAMEQQQFEVRRLRHDLANHLQILNSLPAKRRDAYLAELIENPALGTTLHFCGDHTVNAVLGAKTPIMEQEQIRLDLKADITKELPFDKVDVCALFANAVDNAVEACRKLPEGARWVELKARAQKGIFAVKIANPLPEETEQTTDKTLPHTTKADKRIHGLGLKSIKEIVERYDGSMELKTEDGQFQLFLYMPME